jgi:hypothetical protein
VFVFGEGPALRGPFTFTGNRLIASDVVHDEGSQGAFLFAFARDVTLSGNIVQFQTDMPAVEARGSRGLTLEGNTFNGTTQPVLADSATSDVHS